MAWYEGTMTNADGQLVAILDNKLPLNSCWEIVDTPATNERVYGHKTNGTRDFCVYVKDNQADYATVELWDDWDAVNHQGVGNSLRAIGSNYTLRIRKTTGAWGLRLTDNCFVFINRASGWAYYIGQTKRFDTNRNQPIIVAHTSASNGIYYNQNPLGGINGSSTTWGSIGLVWGVLYDSSGGVAKACYPAGATTSSNSTHTKQYFGWWELKTTAGTYYVIESPVQDYEAPYLTFGLLDGVMAYNGGNGLSNGDVINVEGVSWLVVRGSQQAVSLVRMD